MITLPLEIPRPVHLAQENLLQKAVTAQHADNGSYRASPAHPKCVPPALEQNLTKVSALCSASMFNSESELRKVAR